FETLPPQAVSDGMAEIIKHGMIADAELFRGLEKTSLGEACYRSACVKAAIVSDDEFDRGRRGLLNFGHAVAHALEKIAGYDLSHGRAVAIGMSVMARAAAREGLCGAECPRELEKALARHGLPTRCETEAAEIARAVINDKKRKGSAISLAVPREIGRAEMIDMPLKNFEKFIEHGVRE
ncbi:MAG: hypothetical protein FWE09_02675, partial [Treponema sp.]|nr:hypothetical protein [Treponema sp.]